MVTAHLVSLVLSLLVALRLPAQAAANDGYPCNSVITTITKDEIIGLVEVYVDELLVPHLANNVSETEASMRRARAIEVYQAGGVQYDVLASKVCGSCLDVRAYADETGGQVPEACAENAYGADTPYSALVLHPLDPITNKPLNGKLANTMIFRGTRQALEFTPSTAIPLSLTVDLLARRRGDISLADFNLPYGDLPIVLVTAGAGLIAVVSLIYIALVAYCHFSFFALTSLLVLTVSRQNRNRSFGGFGPFILDQVSQGTDDSERLGSCKALHGRCDTRLHLAGPTESHHARLL